MTRKKFRSEVKTSIWQGRFQTDMTKKSQARKPIKPERKEKKERKKERKNGSTGRKTEKQVYLEKQTPLIVQKPHSFISEIA